MYTAVILPVDENESRGVLRWFVQLLTSTTFAVIILARNRTPDFKSLKV